jgi:transposase
LHNLNEGMVGMIVIGVDIHKRSHTLAAVNASTGVVVGEKTVQASDAGHRDALRFARALEGREIVWALEDCRHVSSRLERTLIEGGERVVRVAPARMGASRRGQRQAGKSDPIDALAVARAVVGDGVDAFPAAFLDEQAMEIRLLVDYREQLVDERTRLQNRLRTHLVTIDPELEAKIPLRSLDQPVWQAKVRRRLARLQQTARVRIAREQITRIAELTRQAKDAEAELDRLTASHSPLLREELGCGPITAGILIGHTAGAERFATDSKFARQAGVAPIPASSGKTQRHRLHPGGNRQLNRALHIIAVVRARNDPATRAYLDRKRAEGKTSKEAIRCLKRHLARHIWRILYGHAYRPQAARTNTVKVGAPALMACTE